MVGLVPQNRIEMAKQLPSIWLPSPPEVKGNLAQGLENLGKFRDDIERVYRLHRSLRSCDFRPGESPATLANASLSLKLISVPWNRPLRIPAIFRASKKVRLIFERLHSPDAVTFNRPNPALWLLDTPNLSP